MQMLWDVAPPTTWAILSMAAILLLAGFVLLSHTLVRGKAHGDAFHGLTRPGRLEWTLRVGAGCLLAGFALWAWELSAPVWVLAVLGAGALASFALEAAAAARR